MSNIGEFPIAYASRSLLKSERNYSTTEKEMLGVFWAVNNFRPYLYGKKFTIVTDHKPLTGDLRKAPNRILKWSLKLAEYNYDIIHKPGKKNQNADALSRIRHEQILAITRAESAKQKDKMTLKPANDTTVTSKEIDKSQNMFETIKLDKPNPKVIIDPQKRLQILNEYHHLPLGGHAGTWRTYKRIKILYYWPNMMDDINKFIRKCYKCKINKTHRRTKVPLTITTTSKYPFQRIAIDIVGPLPRTENNNNYLLTFQDDLTKFSGAIPIQNQEANTVAKAFSEQFITKLGIPEKILTDRGSNFTSKIFEELCKLLKLKHLTTTAYHPESNGALEKSHNTLKEYLRNFTNLDRNNWDEMCHYAMFVYNTTPHCSTNFTPYELVFGKPALIPTAVKRDPEPTYNYDDYVSELKSRLRLAHHVARQNLIKRKEQCKRQYDKNSKIFTIKPGDTVFLKNENRRNKQDQLWLGPYIIYSADSPTNSTIIINKKLVKVHNNRLIKS